MSSILDKGVSRLDPNSKLLKQVEMNIINNYSFSSVMIITEMNTTTRYVEGIVLPVARRKTYDTVNQFKETSYNKRARAYTPPAFGMQVESTEGSRNDPWKVSLGSLVLVTFTDEDYREILQKFKTGMVKRNPRNEYPSTVNEEKHTTQVGIVTLKLLDAESST